MGVEKEPKLQFLHSEEFFNRAKLDAFRRLSSEVLKVSLRPGQPGALKARPDGTVLDGHHRIAVLLERGEDIDSLPREIIGKNNEA